MGVKGLTGLLQKLAPDAVRRKHISDYRGKTLAVDVSCFLNRFSYVHACIHGCTLGHSLRKANRCPCMLKQESFLCLFHAL